MWVIFFQDTPHFWLVGDAAYRVGKKDCHVVIQDDRSISRVHLTIAVGLAPSLNGAGASAPAPQPITLIDSSTYGSSITAAGEDGEEGETHDSSAAHGPTAGPHTTTAALDTGIVGLRYAPSATSRGRSGSQKRSAPSTPQPTLRLTKEVPYEVPVHRPSWRQFTIQLGHHGAQLRLAWLDVSVLCEDVDVEAQTKLEHALRYCGVRQEAPPPGAVPSTQAAASPSENQAAQEQETGRNTFSQQSVPEVTATAAVSARPFFPPVLGVLGGSGVLSLSQRTSIPATPPLVAGPPSSSSLTGQPFTSATAAAIRACYNGVDFLVTSTVQPSTAVVGMLCRAAPIVSPAFFTAIRDRASPQMPLPDPQLYIPPLSPWWCDLISHVQSSVSAVPVSGVVQGSEKQSTASTSATVSPTVSSASVVQGSTHGSPAASGTLTMREMSACFAPNPQRRVLFSDTTFVVVQRALYEEVMSYLDSTGATVVWEGGLKAWAVTSRDATHQLQLSAEGLPQLQGFFTRHQRHVLLYNETEEMPFVHCAAVLQHALGLCSVEYGALIEAIVAVRAPPLTDFPDRARLPQTVAEVEACVRLALGGRSSSSATSDTDARTQDSAVDGATQDDDDDDDGDEATEGRRTDAQPLFSEVAAGHSLSLRGGGAVRARENDDDAAEGRHHHHHQPHQRPRKENAEGWVTFGKAAAATAGAPATVSDRENGAARASASAVRTAEIHYSPSALPPYPCFADTPAPSAEAAGDAAAGANGMAVRRKGFVKQRLPPAEPLVELEEHRARRQLAASMLVARVPTVDADTVVAEQVVMGGGTLTGVQRAADIASAAFNAFDTVVHNASSRRRGTAARRGGGGGRGAGRGRSNTSAAPTNASRRGAASAAVDVDDVDEVAEEDVAEAGPREGGSSSTFHIFDIDGIF